MQLVKYVGSATRGYSPAALYHDGVLVASGVEVDRYLHALVEVRYEPEDHLDADRNPLVTLAAVESATIDRRVRLLTEGIDRARKQISASTAELALLKEETDE